tara:strand:- start:133 stop:1017 length:885 start_codon:yes stop_codon:yes gene_type:complete
MRKNIIDENFVNELCKSGVWDVAKVDLGSVNESAEVEDTDEVSARELAEELFENLSDDIIYECIDILHGSLLNEEDSLDEETLTEEEGYQLLEDVLREMDDEEFESLIKEAVDVLEEEYDLSDLTEEELTEAVMEVILSEGAKMDAVGRVLGGAGKFLASPVTVPAKLIGKAAVRGAHAVQRGIGRVAVGRGNLAHSYRQGKEQATQQARAQRDRVGTRHGTKMQRIQRKTHRLKLKQDAANVEGEGALSKTLDKNVRTARKRKHRGGEQGDELARRGTGTIGSYQSYDSANSK